MSKELALHHNEQRFSLSGLNLELDNFINRDKAGIIEVAQIAAASVSDGEVDALDALIFVKKGSELFEEMNKRIRPMAESKSVGKDYTKFGVKITEAMAGVKYSFDECEDPIYEQLNATFEAAKKELEDRKNFLKSVTKPIDIVVNEAEVYTIQPPIKSGKLGFTLTIK